MTPAEPGRVQLDGREYVVREGSWYDCATGERVPETIGNRLRKLNSAQQRPDLEISDPQECLDRAKQARDAKELSRALSLAKRAMALATTDKFRLGVAAVLCSILRARNQPEEALAETDSFAHTNYGPLLTCRAAAYCDIGKFEDAKRSVGRALVLPGGGVEAAFAVVHRIKQADPDLYGHE